MLAALFGAGNEMDAFYVAFRIPNLVRDLFAEGAMSAAFVPTFTRQLTLHGKAAAWRLANNVLNALLLATLTLVAAGSSSRGPLVGLYAGDYAGVPGKLELTILLTRVMLPFLAMVAVAAVAMGMLNALHHYFVPALSPAMFNVATIVCALVLVPVMPSFGLPGIMAIAIAVLARRAGADSRAMAGARARGIPLCAGVRSARPGPARYRAADGTGHNRAGGDAGEHLRQHAARHESGDRRRVVVELCVPADVPADRACSACRSRPPSFRPSRDTRRSATSRTIRATVSRGLAMMLMMNIPATLGLLVLARPIVELLFEHGRFTAADTEATAALLRLYALGLIGYSAARIASPIFYALRQSRTAVAVSLARDRRKRLAQRVAGGLDGFPRPGAVHRRRGARPWRTAGVACCTGGWGGSKRNVSRWASRRFSRPGPLMAVAAWGIESAMNGFLPGPQILRQGARLAAAIGGGLAVLFAGARLLRVRELDDAMGVLGSWSAKSNGAAI